MLPDGFIDGRKQRRGNALPAELKQKVQKSPQYGSEQKSGDLPPDDKSVHKHASGLDCDIQAYACNN